MTVPAVGVTGWWALERVRSADAGPTLAVSMSKLLALLLSGVLERTPAVLVRVPMKSDAMVPVMDTTTVPLSSSDDTVHVTSRPAGVHDPRELVAIPGVISDGRRSVIVTVDVVAVGPWLVTLSR